MAEGIKIPIIADVDEFVRDMRKGSQAVDGVADAFKDADTASDMSRAERGLKDVDQAASRAADGVSELGDEAGQSAREAAASFSGDPIDALDFLQETAANALGGFGPLGAAAGIAIALGIGVGQAKLEEIADQVNAVAEEAGQLALEWEGATEAERVQSLIERWDQLSTKIADSRQWWEVWQDSAVTSIEVVARAAAANADVAAKFTDAFNTSDPVKRQAELTDSLGALRDRLGELDGQMDAIRTKQQNRGDSWDVFGLNEGAQNRKAALEQLKEEAAALEDLAPEIEEQIKLQEQQNKIAEARATALGVSVEQYDAYQAKLLDVTAAEEAYQGALENIAEPTSVYQDLLQQQQDKMRETAQATADATEDTSDSWEDYASDVKLTTQDLIDEWNRQTEQAQAFQSNLSLIAAAGGQALAEELAAKGPEVAGAVAELIAKASPEEQAALIEAHGRATGGSISDYIGVGIDGNSAAIQNGIDSAMAKVHPPMVAVGIDTSAWDDWTPQRKMAEIRGVLTTPRDENGVPFE